MGRKKNTSTNNNANPPALKIGSRVRCTDDGVTGRIVWANAVSVKVKWDDGEQVTWKRDSLATRPIEILDADDDQTTAPADTDTANETSATPGADPVATPADTTATESTITTEPPQAEPETTPTIIEQPQAEPETTPTETTATEPEPALTAKPAAEPAVVTAATGEQTAPSTDAEATVTKPQRQRQTSGGPKEKKWSALDAAAKVLAEAGQAMNAQEMIQAMADKGYWTSPGGKTPAATIYAAIISEIKKKGADARFVKAERGKFARKA